MCFSRLGLAVGVKRGAQFKSGGWRRGSGLSHQAGGWCLNWWGHDIRKNIKKKIDSLRQRGWVVVGFVAWCVRVVTDLGVLRITLPRWSGAKSLASVCGLNREEIFRQSF